MKLSISSTVFLALTVGVVAHGDHDHDHDHNLLQMPLDYVKYPFQAVYPGDDEGDFSICYIYVRRPLTSTTFSHGGLHFFGDHYLRKVALGPMSWKR